MATVVLNLYTWNFPSIANRLRMSVFLQTDPQAFIASQIDAVAGHPERVWSFPGLPRENYGVVLEEIDGADAVLRQIAYFDVVPAEGETELCRDDEQIQVDTTAGFNSGVNVAVFDGTGGKPDYRGWEVVISELTGRGIMVKTFLDFTWDSATGTFTLLQAGDLFASGTWYNIHFNCQSSAAGNSTPTVFDFSIRIITASTVLTASDFGKKLLVEPGGIFTTVTLPSILTVPQGRRLMIEVTNNSALSVRIVPVGGTPINWIRGNIYMCPNESLTVYRLNRGGGVNEWRVCDADGNFKTVGQLIPDDATALQTFNKKLLNGSIESVNMYARIYNEVVLNLPLSQAVSFASWGTANNKYFYSLANGSGQFHFPDRRGVFERNNNIGKAGDYADESFKSHFHYNGIVDDTEDQFVYGTVALDLPGHATKTIVGENAPINYQGETNQVGGSETAPSHYLINKYVLV